MEKSEFLKLLLQNESPSAGDTDALETIVQKYPFFQAARAIRLKGLHRHQGFAYSAALKKTAAHSLDRGVLFDYITSEAFQQHGTAQKIQNRENRNETFEEADLGVNEKEAGQVLDPELFSKKSAEDHARETENNKGQGSSKEFDKSGSHSFSEWLRLTDARPIHRKTGAVKENAPEESRRHLQIIDEFIAKNPKIKPSKEKLNTAKNQDEETSGNLMTETLAQVYLDQKNYDRAVQAYKILKLKNPEKSGLFADQIRAIEKMKEKK